METTPTKTCRCGYHSGHHMVSAEKEYSGGGWFLLLFGISATPRRIKYRCRVCGDVIESTTDPKILRKGVA